MRGIMKTVDSVAMEEKGGLTLEELDQAKADELVSWWADAWQTLVEVFQQTPKNSTKMRERRYPQLCSWKVIGTTRKRLRQAAREVSPPQKRRRRVSLPCGTCGAVGDTVSLTLTRCRRSVEAPLAV